MTRIIRLDYAVMCNLKSTHTHAHTILPWEDQCKGNIMTMVTGPDCALMNNLVDTHTYTCTRHSEVFGVGVHGLETEIQHVSTGKYWQL